MTVAATGTAAPIALTTGLAPLDDVLGVPEVGQLHLVAAPDGCARDSAAGQQALAIARELAEHRPHGRVLVTTEDWTTDATVARLGLNGRNRHLADLIVVRSVQDVPELVQAYLELLDDAAARCVCGVTPAQTAPAAVLVTGLQRLRKHTDDEQDLADALMTIGLGQLRRLRRAAGLPSAEDQPSDRFEGQRVLVTGYTSTRKVADVAAYYRPGHPVTDFVVLDDAGAPRWPVREGDLRLPAFHEIHAGPEVIDAASTVVVMHRSSVRGNPVVNANPLRLSDTRARALVYKTRLGVTDSMVPLRFDVDVEAGRRGRYFAI